MNEPITNINVTMTIPAVKYQAAAMEIMQQYGDVVSQALEEIKSDLLFNEKFQEEVKRVIKNNIQDAVEKAIKNAATSFVWDLYGRKNIDIEKMVTDAILSTIKSKEE